MVITHTITVLELIWTIVAICGLTFTGLLMSRAIGDREWLINTSANGDHDLRVYIALTSILIFTGGFLTQLGYTCAGIIAMTQPSIGGHPHPAQITISCIFIASSLSGTIFAALIYSRREKIIRLVHEKLMEKESTMK